MQKVIAVVGPTSSGKSALGVELARKFGGEIISADSRQVYKNLDIGTGKITKREMRGVPHHLLDVASPKSSFSVQEFIKLGSRAIKDIAKRGNIPIVVGGTGFYADALLRGFSLPEVPPNPRLREELKEKSTEELFALLKRMDARRAEMIDPYNKVRLVRAIEIVWSLGTVPPLFTKSPYDVLWLYIDLPRETLEKNIEKRLQARLKKGMIAEAQRLHDEGLSYKRMDELGLEYRALARMLQGVITKDELIDEIFRENRAYAKRQIRWFKRNRDMVHVDGEKGAMRAAEKFLNS